MKRKDTILCALGVCSRQFILLRLRHIVNICFQTPCMNFLTYLLTY